MVLEYAVNGDLIYFVNEIKEFKKNEPFCRYFYNQIL
jgi:hypothetical protein